MVGMMEQLLQNWPPPPTEEELAAMRAREIAARRLRGERLPPRAASIWDAQPEQPPGPFSAMPPRYAPDPLEVEANRIQPGGWMGPQGIPGGGGVSLGWLKELLSSINPQGALAGKPAGNFDPMNMRGAAQSVGNALTKPEAPVDPALAAEAAGIKPGGWLGGPPVGMVPNGMPPAPSVFDSGTKPIVTAPSGLETKPETAVTSLDGGAIPLPRPDPRRNTEMGSRAVATQEPGAPLSLAPAQAAQGLPPELQAAGKGGLGFRMPSPAMLFALASGFAGAPSFGQGMRRAFGGAAGVAAQDELTRSKLDLTGSSKADIYRSLVAKGVPPADALAAVNNPKVMEQVSKKYYGDADAKAPTVRENKNPDGTISQEQWNPKTSAWEPLRGHEKPVPGSNRERTLSINDIEKLSAEGQKLAQVTGFHNTFKDQFGGYMSGTVGDLANTYGRNVPWASENDKERADWWQGYQMHKNEVRNKMFGSALTAQESAEWSKADINPGMSPDLIRRNLARQQRILEQATRRKADAAIAAGYPPNSVYTAFGIKPVVAPAAAGKTKSGVSWSVMGGGGEGAPAGGSGTNAPAADDEE